MSDKHILPHVDADRILMKCLRILKDHDFDCQFGFSYRHLFAFFEKEAFLPWFQGVGPALPENERPKKDLRAGELDQMTLECAMAFGKHGAPSVYPDEYLDHVKYLLLRLLVESDYATESQAEAFEQDSTIWPCYLIWEELARTGGLPAPEIKAARASAQAKDPKAYEESPYLKLV